MSKVKKYPKTRIVLIVFESDSYIVYLISLKTGKRSQKKSLKGSKEITNPVINPCTAGSQFATVCKLSYFSLARDDDDVIITDVLQVRIILPSECIEDITWLRTRQGYEISLLVLKNVARVSAANEWNIFSTKKEKFCISKRPCNVLCII